MGVLCVCACAVTPHCGCSSPSPCVARPGVGIEAPCRRISSWVAERAGGAVQSRLLRTNNFFHRGLTREGEQVEDAAEEET